MKRSSAATYNTIASLFVALAVISLIIIVGLIATKPAFLRRTVAAAPTVVAAPTDTITPTPSATFTPSNTPLPTNTPTPLPPSATSTPLASDTPLATTTPLITATPLPTDVPATVASTVAASTFPFGVSSDSPQAAANPDTTTGCKLQAIAGRILDGTGQPYTSKVQVFIFGSGIKKLAKPTTANSPFGGVGFWVLIVGNTINTNKYTVEVLDSKGNQISTRRRSSSLKIARKMC